MKKVSESKIGCYTKWIYMICFTLMKFSLGHFETSEDLAVSLQKKKQYKSGRKNHFEHTNAHPRPRLATCSARKTLSWFKRGSLPIRQKSVPAFGFFATQNLDKKSPSAHHRTTLSGYIFAIKARIDNWKNLFSSDINSSCPHNMVNFGILAAETVSLVWSTPANFNGFRFLAAFLHGTLV